MNRFLRFSYINFIFIIGVILSLSIPAYAQFGGIPSIQQLDIVQNTPFYQSTLAAYSYQDLFSLYNTRATSLTNPFSNISTTGMVYADPFSQAGAQTMSYSNIFGTSLNTGQGYYRDPFYTTGGQYINYSSLGGGFSSDMAYSASPFGGTTHVSSELALPWTYYGTSIDTAWGMGTVGFMPVSSVGASVQHAAFGTPTIYNMMGLSPDVAGSLAVHAYSPETATMNRYLSDVYMFTEEGMPFIANASYFNANTLGGSNWYFPGEISSYETGSVSAGGATSGYFVTQQISGGGAGYLPSGGYAGGYGGGYAGGYAGGYGGGYAGGYGGGYAGGYAGGAGYAGGYAGGGAVSGGAVGGGFVSGAGHSYGGAPGLGW